jgi:branched-subunit amino acid transport protein
MAIISIILLAAITFFTRYLFLEGKLPLRLSENAQTLLSYSAPAVLTAIAAPIVFIRDQQLEANLNNPYLIATFLAVLVAYLTRSIYWTVFIGMAVALVLTGLS